MQYSAFLVALATAASAFPTPNKQLQFVTTEHTKGGTQSVALNAQAVYDQSLGQWVLIARDPAKAKGSPAAIHGVDDRYFIDIDLGNGKTGGLSAPSENHAGAATWVRINEGHPGDNFWTISKDNIVTHKVSTAVTKFLICHESVNGPDRRVFKFGALNGDIPKGCDPVTLQFVDRK